MSCSIFELTRTLIFWSGYPVEIFSGLVELENVIRKWELESFKFENFELENFSEVEKFH